MSTRSVRQFGAIAIALVVLAGCSKSPEERAKNHFARGEQFVKSGDDVKARLEFRNALQFYPNMLEAWKALSAVEDRAKNWPGVYTAAKRISEIDPKDADSRLRLARLSFVSRKFDEALQYATQAVELEPNNPSALALRGAIMLRLGDNKGAVQEANKVLAIDPANVEAVIVLATEKFARGNLKGALSDLQELPAKGQEELGVAILKIRIYETLKDLPAIETELKKLVQLYPTESGFKQELVKFYLTNQRAADAEVLVRSISSADPDNTAAGLDVVRLVGALRGVPAARDELVARIKTAKNKTGYQIALSELDFSQGKTDDAVGLLQGVIKEAANNESVSAARLKLAEMYLARKDLANAAKLADEQLAADTRNVQALRLRGTVKIEQGELESAINDLRAALNDQPRSPELLTLLALAYERGGQIELADKQLADAMRASNYQPRFGLNYSAFLSRRGLNSHLENVLSELAARNPNDVNVLTSLAQFKLSQKDYRAAQEIADRIKKIGVGTGTAAELEAAALAGQKKFDEGITVLQEVHEANPNAIRPVASIVRAYLQANQPEKAEQFINQIIKTNPSNPEAYVMMGVAKLAQNNSAEAAKSFQKAIDVQPASPVGYKAMADELTRQKKAEEALKVANAGLARVPGDMSLRQTKAAILESKGDVDAAIALYEEILKDEPGSMIAANNLASLISDHRSDKESLDRAAVAAAALNKSNVPQFKDTLGWLAYLRGDFKAAVTLLEDAAQQLPNHPAVQFHLGMTYKALGDQKRALDHLNKALSLEGNGTLRGKINAALADLKKGAG
jgi:tetratricopeptide (TPR) repeat protein